MTLRIGHIALEPTGGRMRVAPKHPAFSFIRMVALLVASIGVGVASGETLSPVTGSVNFHIPPQPLIDALQAYSQQSGVQVMFETASAAGLKSLAVDGEFPPEAALRLLLADTDLRIRYSRSRAVTLAPASAPDPDAPPVLPLASTDMALETLHVTGNPDAADHNRLGEYIGTVQSDIQKALKRIGRDRKGEYRFAVKLWVSPSSRNVEKAELDGSTGDRDRDSTISEALRGMTLSQQAPANSPRPIRFMVSIHTL